jgi:hypothetical protein
MSYLRPFTFSISERRQHALPRYFHKLFLN